MTAKNNPKEVCELAIIQFGGGNETIFASVNDIDSLSKALMAVARQNRERAIQIRMFIDLHQGVPLDPTNEISEIIGKFNDDDRRKLVEAGGGTDEDWLSVEKANRLSRHRADPISFWSRIARFFGSLK